MSNDKEKGVIAFAVFVVLALAIKISQALFPYLLIITLIALLALAVVIILEALNTDYSSSSIIHIFLWIFLGSVVLTFLTYMVGFGLGGTSVGQAVVLAYDQITEAEQAATAAVWQSVDEIVASSCKDLSQENCITLQNFAKTAKSVQEITDFADKLKTGTVIVETLRVD